MSRISDKHHLSQATNLFHGRAYYPPAHECRGVPVSLISFHDFGVIDIADADGVCETQAVNANVDADLNGALVGDDGIAVFDVPRNVVAAWSGTAILTVEGFDQYGERVVERSASGTSHTGKKAFKKITRVTTSANITGLTVGSGNVIGLPHRVDRGQLIAAKMGNATDAATFVPADTADATATTGDVRGTVDFATDADGTNAYAVFYRIADVRSKVGAYGVDQFAG